VWAVSASKAPKVTTVFTPSRSKWPSSSAQKVRQRMLGSMPRSSTTSRAEPGGRHTVSRVTGQSIRRVTPSTIRTVGRVT